MIFVDRVDAGRRLAAALEHLRGQPLVVLGLPRGGVPVAYEVALALDAPLDVIVVRKLGVPFQPELGMGAIGEGGVRIINDEVVRAAGVPEQEIAEVEAREREELERRARRFRGDRPPVPVEGRIAVIVDDGIATGSTARAACKVARAQGATRVVLAVPVAPPDWTWRLADTADEMIALSTPEFFFAIGQFYADFSQTTDEEVVGCLQRAARRPLGPEVVAERLGASGTDPPVRDDEVRVEAAGVHLAGHLTVPEHAVGVVVFAHGSGSSRHSPRNRYVADVLNQAHLATLLFDLLTTAEDLDRAKVFDIELLARRLVDVTGWLRTQPEAADLPVGYFGASTGAGAALWAAAELGHDIAAVVSRGGRPDLAAPRLALVTAPTLLIVGGLDTVVIELNQLAASMLHCEHRLTIVPRATHLVEDPWTLEMAAKRACEWFTTHLAPTAAAQP